MTFGDLLGEEPCEMSGRDDSGCIQDNASFELGPVLLEYTRVIVAFDGRVERVTCAKDIAAIGQVAPAKTINGEFDLIDTAEVAQNWGGELTISW